MSAAYDFSDAARADNPDDAPRESNVIESLPCRPDSETIHVFVQRLFATSGQTGLVEIAWTAELPPHKLTHAKLFDLADLDALAEEAARINATPNCSMYVSAGLRRPETPKNARATDADVIACVALWADFDATRALEAALLKATSAGLAPNIVTITGAKPHLRGQLWWVLEEPCTDLPLHRRIQESLARWLSGDRSVVNPSRLMRVAGSVAWPIKQGRILEVTQLDRATVTRAAPFTLFELQRQLERANAFAAGARADSAEPSLDFSDARPALDIETLIQKAREPRRWHDCMVEATSHLLGRGTPPDVIIDILTPRVTMPGYTEIITRNELRVMIDGGLRKGYGAKARTDVEPLEGKDGGSPFLTIRQLAKLPAREFRIKDYLYTDGASMIFAPPGRFKSFLALDMYLSIAYGLPWHGFEVKQGKVLYVCAEGRGGFFKRIRPWQEARAGGKDTDQFLILPQPVNLLVPANVDKLIDAINHHLNGVSCIAFDTVARSFGAGDENSTQDMNAYVAGFDKLVQSGAHVTHIHHSGKDLSKGGRGSSAFNAALDTVIEITREPGDEIATIHCRKMKDDEEPKPLRLRFSKCEGVHPDTGEVLPSLVPTLAGEDVKPTAAKLTKQQEAVLKLIREGVGSAILIAKALNADADNIRKRPLKALKDYGLIFQDEGHFWLPAGRNDLSKTSEKDTEDQGDG
jgi:hypothetical protein